MSCPAAIGGLPLLADTVAAFSAERNFDIFAGNAATGFDACVELCDRHADEEQVALRWFGSDNRVEEVTFAQLQRRPARFAAMLIERGAKPGDRVAGLLPRRPDLRAISSAGEPLDPETAAWLARAFGCPARDHEGRPNSAW